MSDRRFAGAGDTPSGYAGLHWMWLVVPRRCAPSAPLIRFGRCRCSSAPTGSVAACARRAAADSSEKERIWQQLQAELALLVPNARHLIVRDSGHLIQQEQPEAVIDAIRQVVDGVNDPGTG
jgi:hypothetical protein